jgi:uncharacterized lipoprotein YddW (UPF0748 family)
MRHALNVSVLCLLLLALIMPTAASASPVFDEPVPQFRAFWVDAFGPGIYTPAEIDQLVADVKAANMNALVVQVGRRGDCFCNRSMMPRTQAAIAPEPFDPLQDLIDKAHAQGIEVHAWVIATAIWNSTTPPINPNHVFNQHGPSKTGADNWLLYRSDGVFRAGSDYLLDPGHPDAADYIVRMFTSVVANYDIDGIHFDRIRYPDFTLGTLIPSWGYNPVAVARFQEATGRTDVPAPTDAQWTQWRRDQITNIVRRVYLESTALKPNIRVSASTITYGYGPQSTPGGYEGTRTYGEVLQDWRGWMQEGILDFNLPMNYKREHFTTEPNNQLRMYEEWNEFAKDNQYDRQVVIGSAVYLNFITGSVTQVRKALTPSAAGNIAVGWSAYSYRTPECFANPLPASPECQPKRSGDASRVELIRALTQPSEYDPLTPPIFESSVPVPSIPWKDQPTKGHLMGTVTTPDGVPFDQIRVDLYDAETDVLIASRVADGTGWFGFVDLAPGRYKVKVDRTRAHGRHQTVTAAVSAGQVAMVEMTPFPWGQEGNRPIHPTPNGFDSGDADLFLNGER